MRSLRHVSPNHSKLTCRPLRPTELARVLPARGTCPSLSVAVRWVVVRPLTRTFCPGLSVAVLVFHIRELRSRVRIPPSRLSFRRSAGVGRSGGRRRDAEPQPEHKSQFAASCGVGSEELVTPPPYDVVVALTFQPERAQASAPPGCSAVIFDGDDTLWLTEALYDSVRSPIRRWWTSERTLCLAHSGSRCRPRPCRPRTRSHDDHHQNDECGRRCGGQIAATAQPDRKHRDGAQ